MQSKPSILKTLNGLLKQELTAINQYFLHARMLKNWGYVALEKACYQQSIVAMKNADKLIQRIFFLEGLPNLQDLGRLFIGETVEEIFSCDLRLSQELYQAQQKAIQQLSLEEDYVSRELINELLKKQEAYIAFVEEQQNLIADIGLENYLQTAV